MWRLESFNSAEPDPQYSDPSVESVTGDQTVSLWVRPAAGVARTADAVLFDKGVEGVISLAPCGSLDYAFTAAGGTSGTSGASISCGTVPNGVWTHVAVVRSFDRLSVTWCVTSLVAFRPARPLAVWLVVPLTFFPAPPPGS